MNDPGSCGPGVVVLRVERAGEPARRPTRPSSRVPSSREPWRRLSPEPWRPASRLPARPEPWRRPSREPSSPGLGGGFRRSLGRRLLGGRLLGRRRGGALARVARAFGARCLGGDRCGLRLHGLDVGPPGLGERGARLARGGLGALGLLGLAGRDAGLGGLRRGGRAGGLGGLGAAPGRQRRRERRSTFLASRDLRRAAAFGWIAPILAARSSAAYASASEAVASPSTWPVAIFMVLETRVLALETRGPLMAARRSAWRTRFFPDGVRAPVQPRGE